MILIHDKEQNASKGEQIIDKFIGRTIVRLTIAGTLISFLAYAAGSIYYAGIQ